MNDKCLWLGFYIDLVKFLKKICKNNEYPCEDIIEFSKKMYGFMSDNLKKGSSKGSLQYSAFTKIHSNLSQLNLTDDELNKIYEVFLDRAKSNREVNNLGFYAANDLMVLYTTLINENIESDRKTLSPSSMKRQYSIVEKATLNQFSDELKASLEGLAFSLLHVDSAIEDYARGQFINPEKIVDDINRHIKNTLLDNYKNKGTGWKELMFLALIQDWKNMFKIDSNHTDVILTYFFEKCDIFTDTIGMA